MGALVAFPAMAESTYPSRPIRIISPYQTGGLVDILSRVLGEKFFRSMGQPVIVEARPGAGGNIGTAYVAQIRNDPYTLLMAASGPLAPNVTLYPDLSYDPLQDLSPISLTAATPLVLCVNAQNEISDFTQFQTLLKTQGDKVNYATAGAGTPQHLGVELMMLQLGVQSMHIPYKGAAPAVTALLANEVDYSIDHLVLVLPHILAGKLRAIAVTSPKRAPLLPDVPTMMEVGLQDYEVRGWYGLMAPAGVPDDIIQKLNAETLKAMEQPDVLKQLAAVGSENVAGTPEEFRNMIASEITKWRAVIKEAGITIS